MDSFSIQLNNHLPNDITALFPVGSANYNLFRSSIEREFRHHGAPELTHMEFDRIKYDEATGKGSFRVVLDINFTFGCEDLLVPKKGQTSEWTFELNGDTVIFYSSPFAESRTTADEF